MMGASEAVTPPPALRARVLAAADQLPQLPPKVTPIERGTEPALDRRGAVRGRRGRARRRGGLRGQPARQDQPSIAASAAPVFAGRRTPRTKTVTPTTASLTVATSPSLGRMAVRTDGLQKLPTSRGLPDVGHPRRHGHLGRAARGPQGRQGDVHAERRYDGRDHGRAGRRVDRAHEQAHRHGRPRAGLTGGPAPATSTAGGMFSVQLPLERVSLPGPEPRESPCPPLPFPT